MKQIIEITIRVLFRNYYNNNPGRYSDAIVQAIEAAKMAAKELWDKRFEAEQRRDDTTGITLQDYEQWCVAELTAIKKESIN